MADPVTTRNITLLVAEARNEILACVSLSRDILGAYTQKGR